MDGILLNENKLNSPCCLLYELFFITISCRAHLAEMFKSLACNHNDNLAELRFAKENLAIKSGEVSTLEYEVLLLLLQFVSS